MELSDVMVSAVAGSFPPPDGMVEVLPQQGRTAAVVAFSAHFYVCADVDADWVGSLLPAHEYSAPHGARFLVALADRLGAGIGALDVVLARASSDAGPLRLEEISGRDHPRVVRALRYRDDVRVWRSANGAGHVLVGRGLAGRWETAFEVRPQARAQGLGRRLARAAAALFPPGEPVFAQVSPGNVASLRAVLAAGYRPVCAEVLLSRTGPPAPAPAQDMRDPPVP